MPELPEVETIRGDIAAVLEGRRVVDVVVVRDDARYRGLGRFAGCRIDAVRRRGKYLVLESSKAHCVVHLGMSGRLFISPQRVEHQHLRVLWKISPSGWLAFVDRRRFGTVTVVSPGKYQQIRGLATLGPEPLSDEFDVDRFCAAMQASRRTCKDALLSQTIVAGLGNIYVDEALHRSGIHPCTRHLARQDAERLHSAIRHLLRDAIRHRGTSFSLYKDGLLKEGDFLEYLRVYGRTGKPCTTCRHPIVRIVVSGRATHLCPHCQPAGHLSART